MPLCQKKLDAPGLLGLRNIARAGSRLGSVRLGWVRLGVPLIVVFYVRPANFPTKTAMPFCQKKLDAPGLLGLRNIARAGSRFG